MISRRKFLAASCMAPVVPVLSLNAQDKSPHLNRNKIKISLNAYSFNRPLKDGSMDINDLLAFCVEQNLDALDLTAYYFPGYPDIPDDDNIFAVKRQAFLKGLEISGTGVRNDFTYPDPEMRAGDIRLVKNWTECAAKLGAPVIRVFAGKQTSAEHSRQEVIEWMVEDLRTCAGYGKKFGVMVAVQNHNDFLRNAKDVLEIIGLVDSEWFGLVLDIGSLREGDPYEQIALLAPYAVNWQIKEMVYINGKEQKTDLRIISQILKETGYRGYIPVETLGEGDPRQKVIRFLDEVRTAIG